MVDTSLTHNFEYTVEDIENLIKSDIATRLKRNTIPIIDYSIRFNISMEDLPGDFRAEGPLIAVFKGASANIEVPG
jgi:hypothetical protein